MGRFGSISYQVGQLIIGSDIRAYGESRSELKDEARESLMTERQELEAETAAEGRELTVEERAATAQTSENVNARVAITCIGTMNSYAPTWRSFGSWAKDEMGVKDIRLLGPEHAKAYLEHRIDQGISKDTYDREASALSKMETALDRWAEKTGNLRTEGLRDGIDQTRDLAKQELHENRETRAYADPEGLIGAINNSRYQLAAQIQFEAGARVHEVGQIRESQLRGIQEINGQSYGVIHLEKGDTKGSLPRDLRLSVDTYQRIEAEVKNSKLINSLRDGGEVRAFRFNQDGYRKALRAAAGSTIQDYTGSHGLRHNFAQNHYAKILGEGRSQNAALKETSRALGHHRSEITKVYLR